MAINTNLVCVSVLVDAILISLSGVIPKMPCVANCAANVECIVLLRVEIGAHSGEAGYCSNRQDCGDGGGSHVWVCGVWGMIS